MMVFLGLLLGVMARLVPVLSSADFIVLPCNTLHVLLPLLRKKFDIDFIDLIEETIKEVKKYKKIGILCSTKTRNEKLYSLRNIEILYPDEKEQKRVSEIIIKIIRDKQCIEDKEFLESLIRKFVDKGAEKVVLACTDLSKIINDEYTLDTTEILIKAILKKIEV